MLVFATAKIIPAIIIIRLPIIHQNHSYKLTANISTAKNTLFCRVLPVYFRQIATATAAGKVQFTNVLLHFCCTLTVYIYSAIDFASVFQVEAEFSSDNFETLTIKF